jgi:hypothetical protein
VDRDVVGVPLDGDVVARRQPQQVGDVVQDRSGLRLELRLS